MTLFASGAVLFVIAVTDNIGFKVLAAVGAEIHRRITFPMIHIAAVISCLHERAPRCEILKEQRTTNRSLPTGFLKTERT